MTEKMIKFIYNGQELVIQYKKYELMKNVLQRYLSKIQKTQDDVYFLYNGKILDENTKLYEINRASDELVFLVYDKIDENDNNNNQEKNISYSEDIICPKCGESSIITFSNDKINLSSCDKGHEIDDILFKNYKDTQKINEDEIKCNKCGAKRKNTFEQKFYMCFNCNIYLCPLCEQKHNKDHKIYEYKSKNFICKKHGEKMISYCKQCKKNLCDICGLEHFKNHNLIYHREIIENSKITNLDELRKKIDELKIEINYIVNDLNEFMNNLEMIYNISNGIINCFSINNKNYQILSNMKNLNDYNKETINNIDYILNKLSKKQFSVLEEIYIKLKPSNEIILRYKPENNKFVQILGEKFVDSNKINFKMKIDNNISELKSKIDIKQIKDKILEIKLVQINETNDLSFMFYDCSSLISINDNFKLINLNNLNDISKMFANCKSLKTIPDISKWNTENVSNMEEIFNGCESLISLPDISKWNTNNVKKFNKMFGNCKLLSSLPNISKWDFSNCTNLDNVFINCSNKLVLPILPNIKVINGYMFEKQFNKFIDILNSKLLTVKKKEYKFEIKCLTKYLDGFFLHISSINDKQFLNDVEVSKEYMEQYKRIFSLNVEMKNIKIDEINNLISFLKGLLSLYIKNYYWKKIMLISLK